jgi:bacteriocin biosynthesis cyclodehydratase domain-containing protein
MDTELRPSLRSGVGAAVDRNGRLRIMQFARSRHVVYEVAPAVLDMVPLLDGTRTRSQLLGALLPRHPDLSAADVDAVLAVLDDASVLDHLHAEGWNDLLTPLERRTYARQLDFLRDFGDSTEAPTRMLRRLRHSRVLVLGLGGTGTWMAQALALAGVGHLRLTDADVVEPSNLSRQLFYGAADVSRGKTEVAIERLRAQFGELLDVEGISRHVTGVSAVEKVLDDCHLVVNCADEPDINTTSRWVAEACMPRRIPHLVGGGYDGHAGLIGPTILPYESACWTCFQKEHSRQREERDPAGEELTYLTPTRRRHTGALAPLAAVVANVQAWDAIRVLTQCGPPLLANRLGEINFADLGISWTPVDRDPDCLMCAEGKYSPWTS